MSGAADAAQTETRIPLEVELTRAEFDALGEYSCSIPTMPPPGFKWKCNMNAYRPGSQVSDVEEKVTGILNNWVMGQTYEFDTPDPNYVGIRWTKIRLKEAP